MCAKVLNKPPIIEAIFELKWELKENKQGMKVDPNYKLIVGQLYDKFAKKYPFHEQLPAATIPDEMAGGIVQHRFRVKKDCWPLIQVGPGILTINDTEKYNWSDFYKRILEVTKSFFSIYPNEKSLKVSSLILKFINAIKFDFEKENILEFLTKNMGFTCSFPKELFYKKIQDKPKNLDCGFSFEVDEKDTLINIRLGSGRHKDGSTGLVWEISTLSRKSGVPKMPNKLNDWLTGNHKLIEDWFFKLNTKEMIKRFE